MAIVEPITAAGGVVYKEKDNEGPLVLLIFRRGVWDLPKGKLEPDESVRECGVREVAEEVGSSVAPEITFELPDTYHEYEQFGTHYGKTTYWFAMQFPSELNSDFNPQAEEGIKEVSWVPLSKAQKIVGYDNLTKVLKAFEKAYLS